MTKNTSNKFEVLLDTFDGIVLEDIHKRRMAVKPLYDYLQHFTMGIGIHFCGLRPETLKNAHLKTRWQMIRDCLSLDGAEINEEWDALIRNIASVRDKTEHNDDHDPSKQNLENIRKKITEFEEQIVDTAHQHFRKSNRFSFKEAFQYILHRHIIDARAINIGYGEKPPYIAKIGYSLHNQEDEYREIPILMSRLEDRVKNIRKAEDVERADLEDLIQIVRVTSKLRAREELLLTGNICPSCGGKIVESEKSIGGSPDFSDGGVLNYRVGCGDCDYEIHSEQFSL